MENHNAKGELEVTGVSRSGRVRKKSSKLTDFQSPDEIEPRSKKPVYAKTPPASKVIPQQAVESVPSPPFEHNLNTGNISSFSDQKSDDDVMSSEGGIGNDDSLESDADSNDGIEPIACEPDEEEDGFVDPTVRQSIYMSEKSNKKKFFKDGKVIYTKAQRKDKGKTRYTAYMLWAKDVRKQMLSQQPDLDFATVSRRLGEMWANVPNAEKYNLKRRAKRQSTRLKRSDTKLISSPTKFLNKNSAHLITSTTIKTNQPSGNISPQDLPENTANTPSHINKTTTLVSPTFRATEVDPVDVAAHLQLLGDSLTIIGARLKEHEGQITVSGSLSVLLDSLLCSLGPLMCLTMQIHDFDDKNPVLKENLRKTLDNIAYVMPGL